MADQVIKKVIISPSDFPPLNNNAEYLFRYRVISEDKNRSSHWSTIYRLGVANRIVEVPISIDIAENNIIVIWDDGNDKPSYDIFIKFGNYNEETEEVDWDEYFYHGTSPIHTYSLLREPGYTHIGATIQLEGINKEINPILTIAEIERELRSIVDGGSA
jgi:hypothetical protein